MDVVSDTGDAGRLASCPGAGCVCDMERRSDRPLMVSLRARLGEDGINNGVFSSCCSGGKYGGGGSRRALGTSVVRLIVE